jgi:hypothetical protein
VRHDFLDESAAYVHFLRAFSTWCNDSFASQALEDLGDSVVLFWRDQGLVPVFFFKVQGEAAHADVTSEPRVGQSWVRHRGQRLGAFGSWCGRNWDLDT